MIENRHLIHLTELTSGEEGTIIQINNGRMVNNRLVSLGFTPGVQVAVIRNYGHGPLIVTVRGTQVALGRGEASKIEVQKNVHG